MSPAPRCACAMVFFLLVVNAAEAQEAAPSVYAVKQGETVTEITKRELGDGSLWLALARFNDLADANALRAGQKLLIPAEVDLLLADRQREAKVREATDAGKANSSLLAEVQRLGDELRSLREGLARAGLGFTAIYETTFEEDRMKTAPADWEFPSRGEWGIAQDGTRVLEQSDRRRQNCGAVVGDADWTTYIVQSDLRIKHSGDAGIFGHWQAHERNYRLRTDRQSRRLQLVKRTPRLEGGHNTIVLAQTASSMQESKWYTFKLEVRELPTSTYLRGKIWCRGTSEPAAWTIETADHDEDRYSHGKAGVWTQSFGASYKGAQFDNFGILELPRSARSAEATESR